MKKRIYLFFTIAMILLIWTNSMLPGGASSNVSSFFSVPFTNFINTLFGTSIEVSLVSMVVRKIAHFGEFFILGLLLSITIFLYGFSAHKTYVLSYMIGLVVALIDEFIQIFVPDRGPSLLDVGIDFIGVILAAAIIFYYRKQKQIDHEKNIISS